MADGLEATAYARDLVFTLDKQLSVERWGIKISELFDQITDQCKVKKALIGHIKGFLKFNDGGYAYFSNVGNRQGTQVEMAAQGDRTKATLTLNVVLYGLEKGVIEEIVSDKVRSLREHIAIETA